jgi:serine beta-lactamase-like protein LACTB, mitochondrial
VAKPWNRMETWLALGALGIAGLVAAILGLFLYMSMTAVPLHPEGQTIPSVAQSDPPPDWSDAIEQSRQLTRQALVEQNLPGLSVAVGVGGELAWAEGFGWADLEMRVAVTPNHRFRIGTASTVLTSAAVGLLLEEDRLKLDESIRTYVPEFPDKPWPVTLRQLMGNTAGLGTDGGDEGPLFSRNCDRPVEALESFADRTLLFEPGTRYRHSSYGWILVSAAVEAAADEPFLRFMRTRIFEPLGMHDTRADSAIAPVSDAATFYFPRFAADPRYGLHLMRPIDLSCYAGAGVFLSTPSDLVRFGLAIDSGALLQPATVDLLQSPQRLATGEETGYGLGWDLDAVEVAGVDTSVVGRDGDVLGGPVASLVIVSDRGIVVAVTSNISYAGTSALARRIMEVFVLAGSSRDSGSLTRV